jgi:septal ring factor EnvC (AmiA/AmiB activator)
MHGIAGDERLAGEMPMTDEKSLPMNWLEAEIKTQVAKRASGNNSERVVQLPIGNFNPPSDEAASAIDLVSEAAAAMKELENRAAEKMARAQSLVTDAAEKLRQLEARLQNAEAARQRAEADLRQADAEVERLSRELATTADLLAAAEQRANQEEKRANEAEDTLNRVLSAIRAQFPRKKDSAA